MSKNFTVETDGSYKLVNTKTGNYSLPKSKKRLIQGRYIEKNITPISRTDEILRLKAEYREQYEKDHPINPKYPEPHYTKKGFVPPQPTVNEKIYAKKDIPYMNYIIFGGIALGVGGLIYYFTTNKPSKTTSKKKSPKVTPIKKIVEEIKKNGL